MPGSRHRIGLSFTSTKNIRCFSRQDDAKSLLCSIQPCTYGMGREERKDASTEKAPAAEQQLLLVLKTPLQSKTYPQETSQSQKVQTSLISLILQPPFPMREPHWLAGTTSLRVTGGLLAAVLLVIELLMS